MNKIQIALLYLAIIIALIIGGNVFLRSEDKNDIASELVPLRIAYPSGINGQLPKVLEQSKLAEEHGFLPTFSFFQYGPPMIEALSAGEVDVVFTSLNPVASYLAKNPGNLVIVADVGTGKHAVVVHPDSPYQSLDDLRGKKLAVSYNSDLHVDVLRSLADLGLDSKSDVELVNVPPLDLVQAYNQKLVDAVDIRIPPLHSLTRDGARIIAEWPWQFVVAVRSDYLEAHPGVADKVRALLGDGVHVIATQPDLAAQWWADHLRLDAAIVRDSANLNPLYAIKDRAELNLTPDAAFRTHAESWAENLVKYGIRKEKVNYVYQ